MTTDHLASFHESKPCGRRSRMQLVWTAAVSTILVTAGACGGSPYDEQVELQEEGVAGPAANCSHIALQAANGKYVAAELDNGGRLMANRDQIQGWETFELVDLGGDRAALRADNGKYVAAELNNEGRLMANRDWANAWETFSVIDRGDSRIALRADNGKYVAAELDNEGRLMANRDWVQEWETFRVICLNGSDPDPSPDSGGFVTVGPDGNGRNRFFANGRVFRHVGANINQLVYLPQDLARRELQFLQEAGVKQVRVWLPNDAYSTEEIIGRLRWIVDRAFYDYGGIRVTVALAHNFRQGVWAWEGRGGIHAVGQDAHANEFTTHPHGFYTNEYAGLWLLNDSWIDWGYTAYYRAFALRVVSELEDHPGIFAWDIANEVAASSAERWIVQRLVDFYVDMAGAIKNEDPNHLVTTGLISTSWAGMNDTDRDRLYGSGSNIDYLTVHEYQGEGNTLNQHHQNDDIWRANQRYNKPVVVEEFGMAYDSIDVTLARVSSYYNDRYAPPDSSFQVDAIVHWGVTSNDGQDDWGTGDTPFAPRRQGRIGWYKDLWRGWADRLANE